MDRIKQKEKVRLRRKNKFRMRRKAIKLKIAVNDDWELIWQAADHLAVCSCWMCGNPRKYGKGKYKLSIRERKHLQIYTEFNKEM